MSPPLNILLESPLNLPLNTPMNIPLNLTLALDLRLRPPRPRTGKGLQRLPLGGSRRRRWAEVAGRLQTRLSSWTMGPHRHQQLLQLWGRQVRAASIDLSHRA